jgi:adenosylcobinamide kinase/adenosylcobinamide-phosphate guanylyltransferase
MLVLIGGGVRTGKSAFALARARHLGPRRILLATAQAFDAEMRERIARHQAERDPSWQTVEEPIEVPEALAKLPSGSVVVLDCLTLWLSNLLCAGRDEAPILERVDALLAASAAHDVLIVTSEVGMGLVPETALARAFRDVAGRAHQRLSRAADEVYFGALGTMLRIKPGPVTLAVPWDGG